MIFAPVALLLFSSLLGSVAAPDNCGDCSYTPKRTQLCSSHAEKERKTLSEEKREFQQGEPPVRRRALRKVAKLTTHHADSPTIAVTKFLAAGLEDKDIEVRETSLKLLLDGQHPDQTDKALLDAWGSAHKKYRKYQVDLKLTAKEKKNFTKKSTAIFSRVADFHLELPYNANLLAALGTLPDARCESELIELLETPIKKANAIMAVTAAGALLNLDSYAGLEAVIEFQADLAKVWVGKGLAARYPIERPLAFLDIVLIHDRELRELDFDRVALALAKAVEQKGLSGFPGATMADAKSWQKWFKRNGEANWKELSAPTPVANRVAAPALGNSGEPEEEK